MFSFFALLLTLVTPAQATDAADVCASAAVEFATEHGFHPLVTDQDRLKTGKGMSYAIDLAQDHAYFIVACGDDQVENLDLYVYSPASQPMVRDSEVDKTPAVSFVSAGPGKHRVDVVLASSHKKKRGAYYLFVFEQKIPDTMYRITI